MFAVGGAREPEAQSPRDARSAGADHMEPPFIEDLSPDNIHVLRGNNFSLKAKFVGEPTPNVRWFRQKQELTSGQFKRLERFRFPRREHFACNISLLAQVTQNVEYTCIYTSLL